VRGAKHANQVHLCYKSRATLEGTKAITGTTGQTWRSMWHYNRGGPINRNLHGLTTVTRGLS
jgi:hypothetical protein